MHNAIDSGTGLADATVQQRQRSEGWNELPSAKPRSVFAIALEVVREPMLILLVACGSIYLVLGSREDAFILLGLVTIVMILSFFQQRKSERALEALRDLSSPRAVVLRDGRRLRIAGKEVVRGDIIFLTEGDRVPADAILLDSQSMTVDESLLSGESVPVRKQAGGILPEASGQAATDAIGQPGGDDLPFLFSGTLVVQGHGQAQVVAIAGQTALGRIGRALNALEEEPSRVQQEAAQAVKLIALSSIVLVVFLAVWYALTRDSWLNGLLAGLTLAMALLPQELPLILTIFLGMGAWRIARKQVLTRRISAIEMLGAATVLCVDKTGTLTQNRMALAQIMVDSATHVFTDATGAGLESFAEIFHETLEFAMLASRRDPFDPMEKAIQEAGQSVLAGTEHIHHGWTLVEEYPLSPALLAMSRVWQSPDRVQYAIAAKGAPEAVIDLCHLSAERAADITAQVNQLAQQGLRVLAVAKASFQPPDLPAIQHDFAFQFIGLIGLADPLRPSVQDAISQCRAAGIRVIMITGDYPATAQNIALQSGLNAADGLITGAELDALDDAQLQRRLGQVNIFCRVMPQQKLRLVLALKNAGEIVAMTGDGVNDAAALKAAHIGIAMGGRGTDVARESAALVLLDDDFSSIVAAVRLGRRIFDNLRKAIVFVIAAHIPIAGMSLLPVMLGWPLILLPVHIVFFELMIDPTCSVAFEAEAEEPNVMQRPPRSPKARIFDRAMLMSGVRQGLVLLLLLLAVYQLAQFAGLDTEQSRTLVFTAMIIGDIGLIFINRSWSLTLRSALVLPNPVLWWIVASALLILLLALSVPMLRELFHFGILAWHQVALTTLAIAVILGVLGRLQLFRK
ncbi:MAG: cation-translocating P-type ATPase [Oxalobacteraceae bacterium]